MPRRAIRRSDPPPAPVRPPRRLQVRLAGLWPVPALGVAVGVALLLETTEFWQSLNAALQGFDFDPERAALLQAWAAGIIVAATGSLLCGRPWWSSVMAMVFVGITYAWPLRDRLLTEVPSLFGARELVSKPALYGNLGAVLAVAFLAAVPSAATGQLVRAGVQRTRTALLAFRPDGIRLRSIVRVLLGSGLLAIMAGALILTPVAVAVLEYGPTQGVYRPTAAPPRTLVDPGLPPEVVPTSGQVLTASYHSDAMAQDRHFVIYLPPTYGLRAARQHRYPVLYLLHGDPGDPGQWVRLGSPALFDAGSARGVLPETILVMPDGNGRAGAFTDWADSIDGRNRIESAVLELVAMVDRDYRTLADRRYRLIGGLSSGAYGAANIAARNPDVFGTAMSFSGYFIGASSALGSDPAYIRANSPYYVVQDRPHARLVRYVLVVGTTDPYYQRRTQAFAGVLGRLGVSYALSLVPGGHGGEVWSQGLALGMARLAAGLSHPIRVFVEDHDRRRL